MAGKKIKINNDLFHGKNTPLTGRAAYGVAKGGRNRKQDYKGKGPQKKSS